MSQRKDTEHFDDPNLMWLQWQSWGYFDIINKLLNKFLSVVSVYHPNPLPIYLTSNISIKTSCLMVFIVLHYKSLSCLRGIPNNTSVLGLVNLTIKKENSLI